MRATSDVQPATSTSRSAQIIQLLQRQVICICDVQLLPVAESKPCDTLVAVQPTLGSHGTFFGTEVRSPAAPAANGLPCSYLGLQYPRLF